jgi:hypothetical protein
VERSHSPNRVKDHQDSPWNLAEGGSPCLAELAKRRRVSEDDGDDSPATIADGVGQLFRIVQRRVDQF